MISFLKKPLVIGSILLTAGGITAVLALTSTEEPSFETVVAVRGVIVEEVQATGRVQPAEEVELAFERSGRVGSVAVRVGDRVPQGSVLATLESVDVAADIRREEARVSTARAALVQLEAARASKQAALAETVRGSRPEEVAVAEVKVENAQRAVEDAETRLRATIRDAYTTADDAVYNKADQFFSNPYSVQPVFNFILPDSQLKITIQNSRFVRGATLAAWKSELDTLSNGSDLLALVARAQEELGGLVAFFDVLGSAVNSFQPSATLTQTTIDAYKADIASARSAINSARASVNTDTEKKRTAESSYSLAQNELTLVKAGSTAEGVKAAESALAEAEANIAGQKARIAEAEAGVQSARAAAAKTVLHAPINGIVTAVHISTGELATGGTSALSLISDAAFEIEVRIPEVDIAVIEIGASASVSLDAYGDEVIFDAAVASIEPAETIVEGVATYATILSFLAADERIRSGMTANVAIRVAANQNAIIVPGRAIIRDNGNSTIRVIRNGAPVVIPVTTGIRGTDGMVEIVDGIAEGDEVVTFWEEE